MHSYSRAARTFILLVWCLGAFGALAAFIVPAPAGDHLPPYAIAVMVTLAAVAGAQKISLIRSGPLSERSCITLGFFIVFASLIAFGLRACVLVAIVTGLSSSLFPRRMPAHQVLFNVAAITSTAWLCALAFAFANDGRVGGEMHLSTAKAVIAAALVYFFANTGLVATVIGLCSRQSVLAVWRESFLWTALSYLAGASLLMMGRALLGEQANLLLVVPVLAFFYQSYTVYAEKSAQKERHIQELQAGKKQLADLYLATVKSLATAIDAKDQSTHAHIQRVQRYAIAIAEKLPVEGEEMEALKTGALLHDIGKLGVPDYVMLKPGPLTPDEFDKMKQHVVIGASILEPVPFPGPVAAVVRYHHERWDGSGYPEGLSGEAIPLVARILAVADVFDALTSTRPYRLAWTPEQAQIYLSSQSGILFDPRVIAAFLQVQREIALDDASGAQAAPLVSAEEEAARLQIRRNSSEIWAMHEVTSVLGTHVQLNQRMELLGQKIAALFPGAVCHFLLCETNPLLRSALRPEDKTVATGDDRTLRVISPETSGEFDTRMQITSDSLIEAMFCSRRAYRGPCSSETLQDMFLTSRSTAAESALLVPLFHIEEALGVICLYHADANAFTYEDDLLLRRIGEQVQGILYHHLEFDRTRSDALTDPLTGLNNVRYLAQAVDPILKRSTNDATLTPCVLLYLDLDNFKPINDNFGHPQGDRALCDVAQLLRKELRPSDHLVRYGGDEFLILLPDITETAAFHVIARLRQQVQNYRTDLHHPVLGEMRLDVSIGMAYCPRDGVDLHTMVSVADQRMYREKTRHKNAGDGATVIPSEAIAVVGHPVSEANSPRH